MIKTAFERILKSPAYFSSFAEALLHERMMQAALSILGHSRPVSDKATPLRVCTFCRIHQCL
jgi:hypothetical protein